MKRNIVNPYLVRKSNAPARTSAYGTEPKRNEKKGQKKKTVRQVQLKFFCHSQGDTDNGMDEIKGNPLGDDEGEKKEKKVYIYISPPTMRLCVAHIK